MSWDNLNGQDSLVVSEHSLTVGQLNLRAQSRQAFIAEQPVQVTGLEFNLLNLLMERSPQVLSKEVIAFQLFDGNVKRHQQSICTHISNLRKKLACYDTSGVLQILSVRGQGYALIDTSHD